MQIGFVEIQNFRKLKSVRVDFAKRTTLLVGANNSGKTSAMVALRQFLIHREDFTSNDVTLSNWSIINKIGDDWLANDGKENAPKPTMEGWGNLLPTLDVWLDVALDEIHYVSHLLPTLGWKGGLLGVRLKFEPTDVPELHAEYVKAAKLAATTKAAALADLDEEGKKRLTLQLWPQSMRDFLERRLKKFFQIKAYILDPAASKDPDKGVAQPQVLPLDATPLEGSPFKGLIRINEIAAQRGFMDAGRTDGTIRDQQRLSEQLRTYYTKHLDPSEVPEVSDISALQAIDDAQAAFDEKLSTGFKDAIAEVEGLGYPGITDPKLKIATSIRPADSLDHPAAVQYVVVPAGAEGGSTVLQLPESYNGLGYQNLISIIFRLMSFRDAWMKVGKASKRRDDDDAYDISFPPLQLVLIEEPEAHLHAQVQQVFIRKAYEILRKHPDLGDNPKLHTQLVISTHSSHMAHECEFASLRYFRRLPASLKGEVPFSTVINLSEVFGTDDDTKRFVVRYLKATHCDLFFADAAILVEGAAERMLVPHFIRGKYKKLDEAYLTILEIGGSHAHRFSELIAKLGLITLVITDLDPVAADTGKATPTQMGTGQLTRNPTLKAWAPQIEKVDDLLACAPDKKVVLHDLFFAVRVAYQIPIKVKLEKAKEEAEALPSTFEDSLAFSNLKTFTTLKGAGLSKKFKTLIEAATDVKTLGVEFHTALRSGTKAEFALELLFEHDPAAWNVPPYIAEGLDWLQQQVLKKQKETIVQTDAAKEVVK